jgi:hypothetical protein
MGRRAVAISMTVHDQMPFAGCLANTPDAPEPAPRRRRDNVIHVCVRTLRQQKTIFDLVHVYDKDEEA